MLRAPTWAALASLLPAAPPPMPDSLTIYREKNAWCVYSASLWLALEIKGIEYATERVLASDAPKLRLASGAVIDDVITAIKQLDEAYPASPALWPPSGVDPGEVDAMVDAFSIAVPRSAARDSTRAAFLFCKEEGFQYDALPRSTFASFFDTADSLLAKNGDGPFFCGSALSAADVIWAPLLERYAAQIPSLHARLEPRGNEAWPHLDRWYTAMDAVPAYACRVKGDAQSWRKVLSTSPWWPAGWVSVAPVLWLAVAAASRRIKISH